jgi:hypothetical protein
VYIFYFVFKFTIILDFLFGRISTDIICFPVQRVAGFIIVGGGRLIIYEPSAKYASI